MSDFERLVEFTPAWDQRNSDPSKNFGIHGVDLRMVLKGPAGAVQFVLFTGWQLPHVTDEFVAKTANGDNSAITVECRFLPQPAVRGYHSPTPRYEGQEVESADCAYLDGQSCYYGESALAADELYRLLVIGGSDAVWTELKVYYQHLFTEVTSE